MRGHDWCVWTQVFAHTETTTVSVAHPMRQILDNKPPNAYGAPSQDNDAVSQIGVASIAGQYLDNVSPTSSCTSHLGRWLLNLVTIVD